MKNIWACPLTVVQQFDANEAISACGDENKVYKFTCDAGNPGLTGFTVYTNGEDGIAGTSDDVKITDSYARCGLTHEAPTSDTFIKGYMEKNILGYPFPWRQDVIIWRGEDGNNVHCTKNINMDTWETAKS